MQVYPQKETMTESEKHSDKTGTKAVIKAAINTELI
jgi:hypothetical protein